MENTGEELDFSPPSLRTSANAGADWPTCQKRPIAEEARISHAYDERTTQMMQKQGKGKKKGTAKGQ